jgi:hypothetical protein
LNAPAGERAAWIADNIGIEGCVSFDFLVSEVGRQYPQQSDSTCRDLAWKWAALRAPTKDELPDESEYPESSDRRLDEPAADSYLRGRAEAREKPVLMTCPRRHSNGAWFKIEETSDGVLNHQEPAERGNVDVFLGAGGARQCADELGLIDSDESDSSGFWETSDRMKSILEPDKPGTSQGTSSDESSESGDSDESDESAESESTDSGESGEVESEDFDDVDIDGVSDSDSSDSADSELDEEESAVLEAASGGDGSD